jgi:hypothetical protein
MTKYFIMVTLWSFAFHALANAILALRNPSGWLAARRTARRSFDPVNNSLRDGYIFLAGVVFVVSGAGLVVLAVNVTLRVFGR